MSAYIVGKETIDRIVAFIDNPRATTGDEGFYFPSRKGIFKSGMPNEKALNELGKRLFTMNADAVAQRYNEPADYEDAIKYVFSQPSAQKLSQVYFSFSCLSYQCSEGDVPKRKLFNMLEKVKDEIAGAIAHKTADKEGAKWA